MMSNSGFGQIMNEGDSPGFFKILRRKDLSSEIVRMIPHHLIRNIPDEESSYKMVLKVPWGSSWPIKISKNPSFHYMENTGWKRFVEDNALGENEFLTFTHEANMRFKVNIYELGGTEMVGPRKSAAIASSSGLNKREQRTNIYKDVKKEEASSESTNPSLKTAESTGGRLKRRKKKAEEIKKKKVDSEAGTSALVPEFNLTIKKSHLIFLGIPKMFAEMHMPRETKPFKIHHQEKSWEVSYLVTNVQSRFSAGWLRLAKDIGLEVGDVCTFKLIKPTEMLLKISRDDDDDVCK